ncbi:diguanylate cyclase [Candidatus Sumerlaeota bacterium]|nr:diguanylate cyclase [Candidatus Sumerlaeota bacterium]MBI3737120.1 diguanylate cyclase [Candidatus Sumerlaeota bacterium]
MAIYDSVTGLLYSQSALREWITHEINRSIRYRSPFTLVKLEVAELQGVDHATRRKALSSVAKVLKENTRSTDICGRHGRTRLYVLMTGTSTEEARATIERLAAKIGELRFLLPNQHDYFSLTCQVAMAAYAEGIKDADQIFATLDASDGTKP